MIFRKEVEAPDGSIWWVGQWGNLMGRIDPESGKIQEYPLPAGAMPHSVTPDDAGFMWYTGNKNGTIVRLDPADGSIKVYEMPDPQARDPHTAVFDKNGILWFTLQHSNRIGRLGQYNPSNGEIREWPSPSGAKSHPYAIEVLDGVVWYNESGMRPDALVRFDPKSEKFQSWQYLQVIFTQE